MIKVVIINGAGASGKDTFIDLFTRVCEEQGGKYPVYRFSSVDEVKHFASLMGWDGVKDNRGRRFLSDIKDALTRYSDRPLMYMGDKLKEVYAKEQNAIVFFHVREPDEVRKASERFNAVSLLIKRPSVRRDSFTNHADKNVDSYKYEYYVDNSGSLRQLLNEAQKFYDYLINRR